MPLRQTTGSYVDYTKYRLNGIELKWGRINFFCGPLRRRGRNHSCATYGLRTATMCDNY